MKEQLDVLIVKPYHRPIRATIDHDLEAMQQIVGGTIEAVYPFQDRACIVVDVEGKLKGYTENRVLRDRHGEPYDILVGDFFVVGLDNNDFCSLTPQQMDYYEKMYFQPEMFVHIGSSVYVYPLADSQIEKADSNMLLQEGTDLELYDSD